MLGAEQVSDDNSAYCEDRADDAIRYLTLKPLRLLLVEQDAGLENLHLGPVFRVLVLLHLLVGIKVILGLESLVGLDVVIERLDDLDGGLPKLVIFVEHPSVFVWQFAPVLWVGLDRPERWLHCSLEAHLLTGAKQMRKKLLLDLADLLHRLDSCIKDS